ncbi:hypothetical protein ILYODFUR_027408 [Ilyodon furcidens]|uniref:TLC domain-containing protein n=1 Tax=Ilyodon furcidens TaxID=33524 RepID=A0ABV0UVM2_9TELE
MLGLLAAGAVFFPGLFLVAKRALKHLMGWPEGDAVVLSTRLVSSLQAVLASSAGWIITSSCMDVMEDRHWLTESYILFATPYFAYDVFAMFLCYWYKLQVKGHEEAGPDGRSLRAAVSGFLHREVLMVLHHVFMVAFCFPASLVTMATLTSNRDCLVLMFPLAPPSGQTLAVHSVKNSVPVFEKSKPRTSTSPKTRIKSVPYQSPVHI